MADKISRRGALGAGAAGAAALGLAACGGGDADVAEAPPEESEDLTGSIVMWIYPLADSATEEWYQPYVESFNEKYPNVDVQVVQQGLEEHTSELQSRGHLVCRLLLEKKKQNKRIRLLDKQW